jgi:hypothetical protein
VADLGAARPNLILQSALFAPKDSGLPEAQVGLDALDFHRPAALGADRCKAWRRDGAIRWM